MKHYNAPYNFLMHARPTMHCIPLVLIILMWGPMGPQNFITPAYISPPNQAICQKGRTRLAVTLLSKERYVHGPRCIYFKDPRYVCQSCVTKLSHARYTYQYKYHGCSLHVHVKTSKDARHLGASLSEQQNTMWMSKSRYTLNHNSESVVQWSVRNLSSYISYVSSSKAAPPLGTTL